MNSELGVVQFVDQALQLVLHILYEDLAAAHVELHALFSVGLHLRHVTCELAPAQSLAFLAYLAHILKQTAVYIASGSCRSYRHPACRLFSRVN